MSHFSQVKTQIRDLNSLQSALDDLQVSWKSGEVSLRGYRGENTVAAIAINQENGYDIGFRWNGVAYELVADMQYWQQPWSVESFLSKLTQRYAYHTVVTASQNQGFALEQATQQADGSLRLVLQRWNG
jgi:Protein of unknown function (DUF1257)